MEKPFLEVFPGLHIGEELKELLKLVMVGKGIHAKGQKLSSHLYRKSQTDP